MGFLELLLLAIGLSMDAFAVSICKGLAVRRAGFREMAAAGLWFGGFQALMPALGYLLGQTFERYITSCDHWIAFFLLALIGGKMIKEALSDGGEPANPSFCWKPMLVLAVATSIDALAVGITFALLPDVRLGSAVSLIGITTFLFSAAGIKIGNLFGAKFQSKAELAGGVILILIGLKILLDHLGILG